MAKPRRGVALTPLETRRDVILRAAELADELGYEFFSISEGWGFDSTILLTEIALHTRRIKLVAEILSVWGRSPATLAMSAATLHRVSGGRYVLGLGASTKALVEGFHGQPFSDSVERLALVTTKVRGLRAGERASVDELPEARPLRLGLPPVPELPIWIAALGHRSASVAARLADGWFPVCAVRDGFKDWIAVLNHERESAGVRQEKLLVAAGPWTAAHEDPNNARDVVAGNRCAVTLPPSTRSRGPGVFVQ